MAVRQPQKAAKAHHRVCDTARELVDEQVIDLTHRLIAGAIDRRALNVFAGNHPVVGMCRSLGHSGPPIFVLCRKNLRLAQAFPIELNLVARPVKRGPS